MKYAILAIGGQQFQVQEGQQVLVNKLAGEAGDKVTFDQVLLVVDGDQRILGHPATDKVKVTGKIIEQTKDKKIRVATYKAKSRYRRVKGHRSQLTKLLIEKININ